MKILIIGNTGSGKSAVAQRLIGVKDIPWLSLDEIAWNNMRNGGRLVDSLRELYYFVDQYQEWVIEGCHAELVEAAIPYSTELRFLNPGAEECINRSMNKPRKHKRVLDISEIESDFDKLISWIGKYDYRDDEYGLNGHRELFDSYQGPKKEYTMVV